MDILDRVKRIINGYYNEQDEKLYIPEDVVKDVFFLAASKSGSIKHFCVLHENMSDDIMCNCVAELSLKKDIDISQYIALSNAKQLDDCRDMIFEKKDTHFFQGITLLSNVNMELMPDLVSFAVFDDRIVLVLEYDDNGGFYLAQSNDILESCKKWLSVGVIEKRELETSFLQEPLMMSADMMSEVSYVLCSHDHMNMNSCCWYHSVWQYLRLMNMVSTPSWHHDFYLQNLENALSNKINPRVLISGAADYSSLSYVIRSMELLGKTGEYDVLDLCETPLFACKWYAKRKSVKLNTMQISIFDFNGDAEYDLICTDAFLTRFDDKQLSRILSIWFKALKCGGNVVTTVRIHDEKHPCPETPSEDDIKLFSKKAYERSKLWGRVINYSPSEIAKKAEVYASKMKSNKIGTREDVLTAFINAGFQLSCVEDVEVEGELYPSRYLRINARKI